MDLVLFIFGLLQVARAHRMPRKRERHVQSSPIIAATAPFLGSGAVGLRGLTVVEEESGIAFERGELVAVGEDEGSANETAGPVAPTFDLPRIQEFEVPAQFRFGVIAISGVKVPDVTWRVIERLLAHAPVN